MSLTTAEIKALKTAAAEGHIDYVYEAWGYEWL